MFDNLINFYFLNISPPGDINLFSMYRIVDTPGGNWLITSRTSLMFKRKMNKTHL